MHDGGWWSFIRYDEKQDRPQVSWALVQHAAAYGRPYAGKIALMLALILAITLLNLIPPLLTRNLIDVRAAAGQCRTVDPVGPRPDRGCAAEPDCSVWASVTSARSSARG